MLLFSNPLLWLELKRKDSSISSSARIRGAKNIDIGRGIRIAHSSELYAKKGRIFIGDKVHIGPHVIMRPGSGEIVLEKRSSISSFCILEAKGGFIHIGEGTSIYPFSIVYGHGGLRIGKYCMIAAGATIIPANHVFSEPDKPMREQGETRKGIVIEDDVWIASKATVLDGVTIGTGSVIGAGAVVNRDIPPYSVAVGVPARVIKSRRYNM